MRETDSAGRGTGKPTVPIVDKKQETQTYGPGPGMVEHVPGCVSHGLLHVNDHGSRVHCGTAAGTTPHSVSTPDDGTPKFDDDVNRHTDQEKKGEKMRRKEI